MKLVKAADFKNSGNYGRVTAEELAYALNAAVHHRADGESAIREGYIGGAYPYWYIDNAYLEGGPDSFSSTDLHFAVKCGLTENIVEVTLRGGVNDTAYFEDEALYLLTRHCLDYEETVDAEAYERFKGVLVPKMEETLALMSSGPGSFTGYELTRFAPAWSYDEPEGRAELYYFDYALLTDDIGSVV